HDEAEELEHAISDKVMDRIDRLLGHPSVDPHGDPIPTARGKVSDSPVVSLADCPLKRFVKVARVVDQHAPFLQFVRRCNLTPGTTVRVEKRDEQADSVTIRHETKNSPPLVIGAGAAAKILVEPVTLDPNTAIQNHEDTKTRRNTRSSRVAS